jgi:Tol biopolymer transport system component
MDITTSRVAWPGVPWRTVGALALIALLIAAVVAVYVSSQQNRLPEPFGLAKNGLILYASDGDIYAGDPIAGTSRLILGGETRDIEPAYSKDGTRIAFQRLVDPADDKYFRIMAMSLDGSDVHVVTPEPVASPDWWDWTPSGDIIVTAPTTSPLYDMTVYDGAGVDPPRTLTHGMDVDAPVFRPPDGREILFRGETEGKAGVFVMNADGTGLRPLIPLTESLNLGVTLMEPRYSPDGSQIAFHQWDDYSSTMHLFVMNADGTGRREIASRSGVVFTGWPVWSNDGTRIAAATAAAWAEGPLPYIVIDLRTDAVISTGPVPPAGGTRIEWAPDDSSILMSWNDGSRQVLLDPAGGPPTELPWGAASYPSWQRLAPD